MTEKKKVNLDFREDSSFQQQFKTNTKLVLHCSKSELYLHYLDQNSRLVPINHCHGSLNCEVLFHLNTKHIMYTRSQKATSR